MWAMSLFPSPLPPTEVPRPLLLFLMSGWLCFGMPNLGCALYSANSWLDLKDSRTPSSTRMDHLPAKASCRKLRADRQERCARTRLRPLPICTVGVDAPSFVREHGNENDGGSAEYCGRHHENAMPVSIGMNAISFCEIVNGWACNEP